MRAGRGDGSEPHRGSEWPKDSAARVDRAGGRLGAPAGPGRLEGSGADPRERESVGNKERTAGTESNTVPRTRQTELREGAMRRQRLRTPE